VARLLILLLVGLGLTAGQAAEIKLTFTTASGASLDNPHAIFPAKLVNSRGLCNSWFAKAG